GFAANLGLYEVATSGGGLLTDSLRVSTMPSGRSILSLRNVTNGVAAAASTTALRSTQPNVESRYWVPGWNNSGSFANSATASAGCSQWLEVRTPLSGSSVLKPATCPIT